MRNTNPEILYKELSFKVVGLAMKVHARLGCGFLEKIYEKALVVLLEKEKIPFGQQIPTPVFFDEKFLGNFYADLIVDNKIILELKAIDYIGDVHRAQALNYLKATGLRLAIIINFGKPTLEFERIIL